MLEHYFKNEIRAITRDCSTAGIFWKDIEEQYTQNGRYYHTVSHLDQVLKELLPVRKQIEDWQTLIFSIAYHDVVYEAGRQNNEEESADWACKQLSCLVLPEAQKQRCKSQILATKRHEISEDPDSNFFIDADLSVLGFQPEHYRHYTQMVRKEFGTFPEMVYNEGRHKVLSYFLQLPSIYKTQYFKALYEEQARANILSELKTLK